MFAAGLHWLGLQVVAASSGIKQFALGIVLSLVSIALCLLVAEVVLRVRHDSMLQDMEAARKGAELCTATSEAPELIYTGIPGHCGTNSQGYRDHEYSFRKDPGVFRAVVIGDSVAAGLGVDMEDTFAKVLERRLNSAWAAEGKRAEVVVLALNGYSTSQQLYLLEHQAFRYAPDVVVWSYVLNDPADPVYHDANGQIGAYHFRPKLHIVSFIKEKLFLIREKFRWHNCKRGEYHALLHCAYREEIRSDIARIAAVSAAHGVPVIFMIHPVFEEADDFNRYSLAPVHAALAADASAVGLSVLDLLPAYKAYKPREVARSTATGIDPWHPNKAGHRVAAEALFDYLRQKPIDR